MASRLGKRKSAKGLGGEPEEREGLAQPCTNVRSSVVSCAVTVATPGSPSQMLQGLQAFLGVAIIFVRVGPVTEGTMEGGIPLTGLHPFLVAGEEAKPSKWETKRK